MKRLGQELGWVAVVAAVFLLPGFTGCTATLEGGSAARTTSEHPVVEESTTEHGEDVQVSTVAEMSTEDSVDPALAAYAASTVQSPEAPTAAPANDAPLEQTLRVHEIELAERDGDQEITLHLSRSPDDLVHFPLDRPSRVVVDITGPMSGTGTVARHEIGSAGLDRIRIGEHPQKLRVVADLQGDMPTEYAVAQDGRSVVVTVPARGEPRADETVYLAPGVLPASLRPSASAEPVVAVTEVSTQASMPEPVAAEDSYGAEPVAAEDTFGAEPVAAEDPYGAEPLAAELAKAADDPAYAPAGEHHDDRSAPVEEDVVALTEREKFEMIVGPTSAEIASQPALTDPVVEPAETEPQLAESGYELPEPELAEPEYEPQLAETTDPASDSEIEIAAVREIDDDAISPIDHVYEISDEAIEESIADADDEIEPVAEAADYEPVDPLVEPEPAEVATYDDGADLLGDTGEPTYALPARVHGDEEFTGQRISLDFKDADIQNVLRILADVSDLNIITTEDVAGRLTIRLVSVPWDQALDSILKAQGLDMVRDGNIVRISTVEKLKEERDAQRAADEAQKQAEPLRVRYVRVNYAKADEELVKKVQEVLTERGTATWDERTNTIVVRDIARGVASAEELITEFDTQTPQVLIEANIVEATEAFARDLGVQWGYTYRSGPEVGNSTGYNFPGRVNSGGILAGGENSPATVVPFIADFPASSVAPGSGAAYDLLLGSLDGAHSLNARLTALERQGKGKVISRPRVVTLNNVPAKIESLEILRVRLPSTGTVISTGAGGAAGAAQNATEQIRTGIVLEVTPQVSSDGFIFLDVYAKSSALVSPEQSQAPSPDEIPNEVSREAESHVLIKDGETFVLGGVFRNVIDTNDTGLPFLSQIPVLGWAFKNKRDIDNRQELLVFVTPRAVRARGTENVASLPTAENLWQNRDSNP